jgi:LysM repeat protein
MLLSHAAGSAPRPPKVTRPEDWLAPVPLEPRPDAAQRTTAGGAAAASSEGGRADAAGGAGTAAAAAEAGYLLHTVERRDTLDGLALKYGVSKGDIKQANDLPTDNIFTCRTLRIPTGRSRGVLAGGGGSESRPAMVRRFRVNNQLSEPEAVYYLESADYVYATAEAALRKDLAAEANYQGGSGGGGEEDALVGIGLRGSGAGLGVSEGGGELAPNRLLARNARAADSGRGGQPLAAGADGRGTGRVFSPSLQTLRQRKGEK